MAVQTWDEARGVRTLTDEEFIQEFGERHYRELMGPPPTTDPETLTEGRRALLERMQAEAETSASLAARGLTLDDLVVEGEGVPRASGDEPKVPRGRGHRRPCSPRERG